MVGLPLLNKQSEPSESERVLDLIGSSTTVDHNWQIDCKKLNANLLIRSAIWSPFRGFYIESFLIK